MIRAPERLLRTLQYQFTNTALLNEALTHRSAGNAHNERLEFLGDSVLNLIVSTMLFERFPTATEGELSRLRSNLVKEQTLAEIARALELGEYLALGSGELKSGGFRRDSIIADALEALLGSVYLDGGFTRADELIRRLYEPLLETVSPQHNLKDPKSQLQEALQARRMALPLYEIVSVSGEPHDQSFCVRCVIADLRITTEGGGTSRRKAEQEAARKALDSINKEAS